MQILRNLIQVEFENLRQNPSVTDNAVRSMEKRARICIEKYGRHVEKNFTEAVPDRCVRQNSCYANMQHVYRRTSMWKCWE